MKRSILFLFVLFVAESWAKDIVFVYLTDESSVMNDWRESVIRILGLHYCMPSSQWSKIPGLNAIPQYYISTARVARSGSRQAPAMQPSRT